MYMMVFFGQEAVASALVFGSCRFAAWLRSRSGWKVGILRETRRTWLRTSRKDQTWSNKLWWIQDHGISMFFLERNYGEATKAPYFQDLTRILHAWLILYIYIRNQFLYDIHIRYGISEYHTIVFKLSLVDWNRDLVPVLLAFGSFGWMRLRRSSMASLCVSEHSESSTQGVTKTAHVGACKRSRILPNLHQRVFTDAGLAKFNVPE